MDVSPSALFYIPEKVWNDTSPTVGLDAGGGGVSTIYPKPSWQSGAGVPSDGFRDVPDVSMNASPQHDGYLICVQGSCVSGYRNPNNATLANALSVVGGTSAAVPTFGGIVALINQSTGSAQGNINYNLYPMAASSPAAFHDITTGNNMVPCTSGTTDCPGGGLIGYNAGPGYDPASGLGSVDAYNLVTTWGSAGTGNLPAPTLTAPTNGLTAAPLTTAFSWTAVASAAGYRILVATSPTLLTTHPTVAACSSCTILATTTGNTATSYAPVAGVLAASTLYYWQVQALEPSTSNGTAAWSNVFVFNTGAPDFTLGVSPTSLTINPGASSTSTLTLTPVDNLLPGTVTFSCSVPSALAGVTCAVGTLDGNNTATVTLTASSSATSYPSLPRNPRFGGWWAGVAGLCLLLMASSRWRCGGLPAPLCCNSASSCFLDKNFRALRRAERRSAQGQRRWPLHVGLRPTAAMWNLRHVALGAVLAALLLASLSCGSGSSGGGGSNSSASTPTPQPESGTVTITGASPSATHTASISLSVS